MKAKIIYLFSWMTLFIVGLICLNGLFLRKDAQMKYEHFFEADHSYDVLFFGTSHVMDAVYPTELYDKYGIRSYNLGNPAETLEASYYTMKIAFKYHVPKIAVIDVAYVDKRQDESRGTMPLSHAFYDAVPFSMTKAEAVFSLFPPDMRAEFLFPLVSYHMRWEEWLMGTDSPVCECEPYMMGAEMRNGHAEPDPFVRTDRMNTAETPGKKALRSMIHLCRENNVLPVLVGIPFPAPEEKQAMMNSVAVIAREEDACFLNLFDVSGLIDFKTDCYDAASHLNPDGAIKVSAYLGEYLKELIGEQTSAKDEDAFWQRQVRQYQETLKHMWSEHAFPRKERE